MRTSGRLGAAARGDPDDVPGPADPLHDDTGQVRQQRSKITEIAPRT
jgi:hypothetical protein